MKALVFAITIITITSNLLGYFKGDITPGECLVIFMLLGIFINTFKEIE